MSILSHSARVSFLVLLVLVSSKSLACTSIYIGDFLTFSQTQPVIVRATVTGFGAELPFNADYFEEMFVEVDEVIKGDFPHGSIVFYGDTGMSCLRYITRTDFPVGSEHLFILESSGPRQPLLVAGESSVRIVGDSIVGKNHFEEYSVSLDEFIDLMK